MIRNRNKTIDEGAPKYGPTLIKVPLFTLAICLVFSTNTLYSHSGRHSLVLSIFIVVSALALLLCCLDSLRFSKTFIWRWVLWLLFLLATYATIGMATATFWGSTYFLIFVLMGIFPLAIYMMWSKGLFQLFISLFVISAAVLATASLILWVAGPLTGLISTNCSIVSNWNSLGEDVVRYGYFHLLYVVQSADLGGHVIVRNTGIFTEAPMYSYMLCVAILGDCLSKRPHPVCRFIFALSILTALSTTGYIFLILIGCTDLVRVTRKLEVHRRVLAWMAIAIVTILAIYVVVMLLGTKIDSSSGSTRIDDFRAGYLAWISSPILGYGFTNGSVVQNFYSAFRMNNLGFSNSLMDVLVRGGILYLSVFVVQAFGLIRGSLHRSVLACIFLFLWVFTTVARLPLSLFVFSLGVTTLLRGEKPGVHGDGQELQVSSQVTRCGKAASCLIR